MSRNLLISLDAGTIDTSAVTLANVKEYLRVDYDADDTTIQTMIDGAWAFLEGVYNRSFSSRTHTAVFRSHYQNPYGWPAGIECDEFDLPRPPQASITSITRRDYDGTETVLTSDDYYEMQTAPNYRIRIINSGIAVTGTPSTYTVVYTAGEAIQSAIIQDLYDLVEIVYNDRGMTFMKAARERTYFGAQYMNNVEPW